MNQSELKKAFSKLPLGDVRYFDSIGSTNTEVLAWSTSDAKTRWLACRSHRRQKDRVMNRRNLLVRTLLVALTFFVAACGTQTTSEPAMTPMETLTPVPPTETPTPTLEPTSTPTLTPTPIGGKSGLLLNQLVCPEDGDCVQTIFLYNLVSYELISFLEGYTAIDVSPDGKKILLNKNLDPFEAGDLFILDLAKPEQITLLQENVYDPAWLGDSGWIGFISKVNGKRQVFIVHPNGNDLTQVTNSSIGAGILDPVFNDGVFWVEGTVDAYGSTYVEKYKWTKLDGTETELIDFGAAHIMGAASHSGKYVITTTSTITFPLETKLHVIDLSTGATREISLSKPAPDIDLSLSFLRVQPLSNDKWLIERITETDPEYWIYSSDGDVLAELPSGYSTLDITNPPSSYDLLSPDGNWILSQLEEMTEEQFEVTYHLFNTMTSEIKDLPNLCYPSTGFKWVGNRWFGCVISNYFWVEIP